MQALSWPLTPIVGQVFKGFAYDGKTWAKAKPKLVAQWTNVQVFTASGRYTPSDDLLYAIVECIGPGGGGGWAIGDVDGVTNYSTAAGGGGSGGYSRSVLMADEVAGGADVVIGMGGLVGLGNVGGGTTAGMTNFGGIVTAMGGGDAQGYDGSGNVVSAHGLPGIGAPAAVGDFVMPGAAGGMWTAVNINIVAQHLVGAAPGVGGQLFGGAQWPTRPWLYTTVAGVNGLPNSGAGGGGGQVNGGPGTSVGGAGGSGLCVVTEICGTEDGGPIPPEPPGPCRPPGVPINLDVKARVMHVPWDGCGLHPMPVKGGK